MPEDRPDLSALVTAEIEARRDHARGTFPRAVWQLVLGDVDGSLETIRAHLAAPPQPREHRRTRAELATIAGGWQQAADEARLSAPELAAYVPGYRDYVAAMLALVADDGTRAAEALGRLEAYAATHPKLPTGHPSTVTGLVRGLVHRDPAAFGLGVDALLGWHLRRIRQRTSEVFNSAQAVVCLEAVVALLVGHRRGLSPPDLTAFRRVTVPLLVVHLAEWRGQPLPSALPVSIEADVVAGPWLRGAGLPVDDAVPGPAAPAAAAPRSPRPRQKAAADPTLVREDLRRRLASRIGPGVARASWALLLGEPDRAREEMRVAAGAAREAWRASAHPTGRFGWFRRADALPNGNLVREHFALALAVGDEAGVREAAGPLQRWIEHMAGVGANPRLRYHHQAGYLDLICELLFPVAGHPDREEAGNVLGTVRVACVGLVERDPGLLARGVTAVLSEHVEALEGRVSISPPLCEPALHLAAAARRTGLPLEVEDRFRSYAVPIRLEGPGGEVGRLPLDLLGEALGW